MRNVYRNMNKNLKLLKDKRRFGKMETHHDLFQKDSTLFKKNLSPINI